MEGFSLSRHTLVSGQGCLASQGGFTSGWQKQVLSWSGGQELQVSPLPSLQVLVLGNKRDLPGALDEKELIEKM